MGQKRKQDEIINYESSKNTTLGQKLWDTAKVIYKLFIRRKIYSMKQSY